MHSLVAHSTAFGLTLLRKEDISLTLLSFGLTGTLEAVSEEARVVACHWRNHEEAGGGRVEAGPPIRARTGRGILCKTNEKFFGSRQDDCRQNRYMSFLVVLQVVGT